MRPRPKLKLSDVPSAAEPQFSAVWDAIERELGLSIESHMRRYVETLYVECGDSDSYDLTNEDDRAAVGKAFAKFARGALNAITKHRSPPKPRLKSARATGQPPIRQREREKNARLLAFCAERIVPFSRLLEAELKPGRIGREGVPWEELHTEWLRTFPTPADWVRTWGALKREYYLAAKSPHLSKEFLDRLKPVIDEEWAQQRRAQTLLREAVARAPERACQQGTSVDAEAAVRTWMGSPEGQAWQADLRALRARLRRERERFRSEGEYREWRDRRDADSEAQYRAGLALEDLVRRRSRRIFYCRLFQDPDGESRLQQSPLREWFIPEARGEPMQRHTWGRGDR